MKPQQREQNVWRRPDYYIKVIWQRQRQINESKEWRIIRNESSKFSFYPMVQQLFENFTAVSLAFSFQIYFFPPKNLTDGRSTSSSLDQFIHLKIVYYPYFPDDNFMLIKFCRSSWHPKSKGLQHINVTDPESLKAGGKIQSQRCKTSLKSAL